MFFILLILINNFTKLLHVEEIKDLKDIFVAVLSFAFSQNHAFLYLLPFCIVIPMSLRISYYLSAMAKLSSYMIVFLEDNGIYSFETNNRELINTRMSKKRIKFLISHRNVTTSI